MGKQNKTFVSNMAAVLSSLDLLLKQQETKIAIFISGTTRLIGNTQSKEHPVFADCDFQIFLFDLKIFAVAKQVELRFAICLPLLNGPRRC